MDKRQELQKICKENNIVLAYLFGSQVETGLNLLNGKKQELTDPLADIDVGVIFRTPLPGPKDRFLLYSKIYNQLEDLFIPYPLDLVFLQETHSVFQANAVCGQCIYYEDLQYKEAYEENILRFAADFRPFLDKYYDEILEEVPHAHR